MSLSGPEYKELQEALIHAFPNKSKLKRMVRFNLDKNLEEIAGEADLQDIVFNLIKKAESENWTDKLIQAALSLNPTNLKLQAIAEKLSVPLPSTPTRGSTQQPPEILTPPSRSTPTRRSTQQSPQILTSCRRNFFYLALGGGAGFVTGVFHGNSINQPSQTDELKTLLESSPIPNSKNISQSGLLLKTFDFKVVTVDSRGRIISRIPRQAQCFKEDLPNGVILEMVKILGGTFMMGTEDEKIERLVNKFEPKREVFRREKPQHEVTVKSFFMGRYPITQAQWKAVAALPKVKHDLNPDPSRFKGDNLPVEQVSWYDAVEFCDRLSDYTGKRYRLPSEAEWEYACRTGTNTPFYFGETITDKLANYRAYRIYADEREGEYRQKTTPVETFPPNAFGLYDMHGNVWQWCEDTWHTNYNNAPKDGKAWIDNDNDNSPRVLRGGSWGSIPEYCRSASRISNYPKDINIKTEDKQLYGFRVVYG